MPSGCIDTSPSPANNQLANMPRTPTPNDGTNKPLGSRFGLAQLLGSGVRADGLHLCAHMWRCREQAVATEGRVSGQWKEGKKVNACRSDSAKGAFNTRAPN